MQASRMCFASDGSMQSDSAREVVGQVEKGYLLVVGPGLLVGCLGCCKVTCSRASEINGQLLSGRHRSSEYEIVTAATHADRSNIYPSVLVSRRRMTSQ